MKSNSIAIDLGSSKTSIYQVGVGVVLCEPSIVAVANDSKLKIKEIGSGAKKLLGKTSEGTRIVSPIFESAIEDEAVATAMLENFLNKITIKKLSARPSVVFSVPCGIELPQIRKFEKMLISCDISNYSFVESPILTALGLGISMSNSNPCFIVDIGGGSTDIAAVTLDGVICGININMGGISIDAMLQNYIKEVYGLKIGALTSERMKISIGSLLEGDQTQMVINGRDINTGKPTAISIKSSDILPPIRDFFDKIFQIMGMVMSKLPAEVSADIRRNGVYFSGGVSKTVGLEEYFTRQMGVKANVSQDAEMATIVGGGIVASNKELLKQIRINKR